MEYTQSPSSGFYDLLRVEIWSYCPTCWVHTMQKFHHEDDKYEYYECEECHCLHKVAVR